MSSSLASFKGSDQAIFGNAVRLYGGNIQVHAPGFREKTHRFPLIPLENPDKHSHKGVCQWQLFN
ncbi:MAG: hypothetical protein JW953_13200 [Anaerolineae bacterium]|nr:hypothetical protein [Anaerolineae bacterium]